MKDLVTQLSHWNNGLDQLTSRLDQDSSRRRLRTFFSTSDTTQLRHLEAAADLLEHRDIQLMAAARIVIEQGYLSEQPDCPPELAISPPGSEGRYIGTSPSSGYRLEMDQLQWQGKPYATDQIRAMARYGEESVIVDWRCCQDDKWRRTHPKAFRRRTENLTKILNSDLKPLSLSILHCVGYLNQSNNVTGYAFRLPNGAQPGQEPFTLYDLLKRIERPNQPKDSKALYNLVLFPHTHFSNQERWEQIHFATLPYLHICLLVQIPTTYMGMLTPECTSSRLGRTIRVGQSACHNRIQYTQHWVGTQEYTIKEHPFLAKAGCKGRTGTQQTISDGL